jgi:hypothetical protein
MEVGWNGRRRLDLLEEYLRSVVTYVQQSAIEAISQTPCFDIREQDFNEPTVLATVLRNLHSFLAESWAPAHNKNLQGVGSYP